jgi:hypothetical protein
MAVEELTCKLAMCTGEERLAILVKPGDEVVVDQRIELPVLKDPTDILQKNALLVALHDSLR